MSADWISVSIDEIKSDDKGAIAIGPFGSRMKSDCYVEKGIPVIRGTNITGGPTFEGEFVFISKDKADELGSCNVYKDDLVFPHRGSIGEVGIILKDERYVISSSLMKLTCNPKKANPKFIYYFFKSKNGKHELLKNASQVGTPGIGQPLSSLKSISLNLPPLETQNKIASILSSLDDKIHLNTQTNQTLESIAQAIFKSWFVDFEPVKAKMPILAKGGTREQAELAAMGAISGKGEAELAQLQQQKPEHYQQLAETAALFPSAMVESELGEIPEGWEVKKIKESASIIKGKSYKSTELQESKTALVTLKSFTRGGGYRLDGLKGYIGTYKKEQEVFAGDLVIAYTDVTQAADVIGKPALVISDPLYDHLVISLDVAVIRPTQDIHKFFFYGLANTEKFQQHTHAHSTGTTVLHLSASAIPDFEYTHPTENLLKQFSEMTKSIFQKKDSLIAENRSLESLRDSLLPKLLSGEIDLSDIQSEVA